MSNKNKLFEKPGADLTPPWQTSFNAFIVIPVAIILAFVIVGVLKLLNVV